MSDLKNKLSVNSGDVPDAGSSRPLIQPWVAAAGVTGAIILVGLVLFLIFGQRAMTVGDENAVTDSSIDKNSAPKPTTGLDGGRDRTKEQIESLQGKWYGASQVINGVEVTDYPNAKWTSEFLGQNLIVRKDGQLWTSGTWTLDATKTPSEFSRTVEAGKNPGRVMLGIIKFEGEDVILCERQETRPERFESLPGDGFQVTRLSRKPPQ